MSEKGIRPQHGAHRTALRAFEVGSKQSTVDRDPYEKQIETLPPDQRELAQESARLADFCRYFSEQKIDLPREVLEQIGAVHTLTIPDRIQRLRELNRLLMQYVDDIERDPGVRH